MTDQTHAAGKPVPPSQPPSLTPPPVITQAGEAPADVPQDGMDDVDVHAGDEPSTLARRVGPLVALVSLLVTIGMVAWMSVAPTNVGGPLANASFSVPGTLVTPVSDAGCVNIVDGRGVSRALCVEGAERYSEVFFDDSDRLIVGLGGDPEQGSELGVVDLETGEVLERVSYEDAYSTPPEPPRESSWIEVRGSKARDPETQAVLLDVDGPPGYQLEQAAVSPDGAWVVATDPRGRVIVAPTDGSSSPRIWADYDDEGRGYLDLQRAVLWDDAASS